MTYTLAELTALSGARLVHPPAAEAAAAPAPPFRQVAVDSRCARPQTLFVALPGARADGHDFIADAFAAGAGAALISAAVWRRRERELREQAHRRGAALLVAGDPLLALHRVAAAHRARRSALRVAVTGSNGKTTTRHLLGSILAQHAATYESERNYNSDIGLPLAMLGLEPHHRLAVLEAGIDRCGEMDLLGKLAQPHHAVITGIGSAHLAALHSRAGVAAEKSRLFAYLQPGGCAFVPEGEQLLAAARLALPGGVTRVPFGPTTTQGYEGSESLGLDGSIINWEGLQIHFPLFGNHNVANVLAAITVAATLGVPAAAIRRGLEAVRPVPGRSQVIHGCCTVINDAYNANPESMAAALRFVTGLPAAGRVILVIGSMLELGAAAAGAHAALGEPIAAAAPAAVFLFGAETAPTAEALAAAGCRPRLWTTSYAELEAALLDTVRRGDTVLLKGSRGVALDRLVAPLQAARLQAA